MNRKLVIILCLIVMSPAICFGDEPDAAAILARTVAAYEALDTYQSEGKVVVDMQGSTPGQTETTFTILMKKPSLYLITWEGRKSNVPLEQGGAVWNAGERPYLYMGITGGYSAFRNDEMAIASATGISGF